MHEGPNQGAPGSANASSPVPFSRWKTGVFTALVAIILGGCGTPSGSIRAPGNIDLSGNWHLNPGQSDSLDALLASVKDELDPPLRFRVPPAGDEGTGRIRSRRDEFVGPPRTKELASLLSQPDDLTVTQSPRDLVTKGVDGTRQYGFGESSVVSIVDGLGDQRAGWVKNQFVVTIRATDGRRIEHRLGLTADRRQLQIVTSVSGGGLPSVRMTRVYDRVAPG